MTEKHNELTLVSIVAIVAIVGLVILFVGKEPDRLAQTTNKMGVDNSGNTVGEAYRNSDCTPQRYCTQYVWINSTNTTCIAWGCTNWVGNQTGGNGTFTNQTCGAYGCLNWTTFTTQSKECDSWGYKEICNFRFQRRFQR